jgi:hypothetical protein
LKRGDAINLTAQVLNHNVDDSDVCVRHKIDIAYKRDDETEGERVPLYPTAIFVMASLGGTDAYFEGMAEDIEHEGTSCAVGSFPKRRRQLLSSL